MRILFAGTPAVAVPSLEALAESGEVVGVLTRPDAPVGRKRVRTPSPVAVAALARELPLIQAACMDETATEKVALLRPDVVAIVAYGALIPPPALMVPPYGWVNLHFSLLPAWRGAAPVQHAIWHGADMTGATTFQLEAGLDTGPIYDTVTEPIGPHDTASELLGRLAHRGAALLKKTLASIAAGIAQPQPQTGTVTLAPKITPDLARINFEEKAQSVDRHIRAMSEHPGAWATFGGARMKVGPVRLPAEPHRLPPGVLEVRDGGVFVGTGSFAVELRTVQPAGKKAMAAVDWARGALRPTRMVLNG